MARSVRLIAVCDEYDTQPGLAVKGTPLGGDFFADRTGEMIAHDIIEHQNGVKNIGTVDDELEALGGVWHTRGRWGDFVNQYRPPAYHVATDIVRMYEDEDYWTPRPKNTRLSKHVFADDFDEIIEEARKMLRPPRGNNLECYLKTARWRLQVGFTKADRRFGEGIVSNNMYRNIVNAVAPYAKHIEFEGQEFILTYDQNHAQVRPIYDYY